MRFLQPVFPVRGQNHPAGGEAAAPRDPSIGPLDTASLLLARVLSVLMFTLVFALQSRIFLFDPIFLYFGLVSLVKAAGVLVFWVIIVRSLMSWISRAATRWTTC